MKNRILRTPNDLNAEEIRALYAGFEIPITALDCGQKCAPHNPSGKPFCCDSCEAVPAAYESEWEMLEKRTELWHLYRGDECETQHEMLNEDELPEGMIPLACLGPQACERENRLLSCRQFPFFPYISSDDEFLGLAYDHSFEEKCWVISHLDQVSEAYRVAFIETFEQILALFQDEFDAYALRSEEMRAEFIKQEREIIIILREGGFGKLNPRTEHIQQLNATALPNFGVYTKSPSP